MVSGGSWWALDQDSPSSRLLETTRGVAMRLPVLSQATQYGTNLICLFGDVNNERGLVLLTEGNIILTTLTTWPKVQNTTTWRSWAKKPGGHAPPPPKKKSLR